MGLQWRLHCCMVYFFNTIQLFNMICCLCIGFAGPLFGATLLLWKPCFFSSMSFMEKWQRYPAVKRLGRVLEGWTQLVLAIRFWSAISIFGSGIYASVWERHTYYLLNEKWGAEYQSLRASRKGQIFQVWRKFVTKTCHKAYWKSLERIVDGQQACLFGIIARPASIQY